MDDDCVKLTCFFPNNNEQKRSADESNIRQCTSLHGVSIKMHNVTNLDEEVNIYLKSALQNIGYRTDTVSYNEKVLLLLNC